MREDLPENERRKSLAEEFISDVVHTRSLLRDNENIIRIDNFLNIVENKFKEYVKKCDVLLGDKE